MKTTSLLITLESRLDKLSLSVKTYIGMTTVKVAQYNLSTGPAKNQADYINNEAYRGL